MGSMNLEDRLRSLLSDREFVGRFGASFDDIQDGLKCDKKKLNAALRKLAAANEIVSIPLKRTGKWYLNYYVPDRQEHPVGTRLEEVLSELAVPPWIEVRLFRGPQTIFIGQFEKPPGFTIIDYGVNPPRIFRNHRAGGRPNEIVNYKRRYKCEQDGKTFWYNYRGQKIDPPSR